MKDLQFNTMNQKDLFALIEQKMYPPGIVYSAECMSGTSRRFSCKVAIAGATTMGAEAFFNISAEVQQPSEVQQPPVPARKHGVWESLQIFSPPPPPPPPPPQDILRGVLFLVLHGQIRKSSEKFGDHTH